MPAASQPQPETVREFLDSVSDSVLAQDRTLIFRRDGSRRIVDLGAGVTASLDERPTSRLDSTSSQPTIAAAPGQQVAIDWLRPHWQGNLAYRRAGDTHDVGLLARWPWGSAWSVDLEGRQLADDSVGGLRRDSALSLRHQGSSDELPWAWWADAGVHHASVLPTDGTGLVERDSANFVRLRAEAAPRDLPELRLGARIEHPTRAADIGGSSASSLVFSADYQFAKDDAATLAGWPLAGTHLFWREAPRLSVPGDVNALEATAAYKRVVGAEVPDGTPGGWLYAQWRDRSVAAADDSLAVVGWRHAWQLDPRWSLSGHVEEATPLGGPNAARSLGIGGRLNFSAFPVHTFLLDVDVLDADRTDSAYAAATYTARLADDWLGLLNLSGKRRQPSGQPELRATDYDAALTLGWREPERRTLAILGRYGVAGTVAGPTVAGERRARIAMLAAGDRFSQDDSWAVRSARRIEHRSPAEFDGTRVSQLMLARWVHDVGGPWSLSAHVGRLNDTLHGNASGYGLELGLRVSSKAVVAVGYNPRGFDESELQLDERLGRGPTLRLRFSIDAIIGRWLDAPRAPPQSALPPQK